MSKKEQRIRKIKKGGFWSGFVALLVVTGILTIVLAIFVETFIYFTLKETFVGEHDRVEAIANCYENGISDEEMDLIFGSEKRIYIVKDANGKVLHQTGEDTISDEYGEITLNPHVVIEGEAENDVKDGDQSYKGGKVVTQAYSLSDDEDEAEKEADQEEDDTDESVNININVSRSDGEGISRDIELKDDRFLMQYTVLKIYRDKEIPVINANSSGIGLDLKELKNWAKETNVFGEQLFYQENALVEFPYWIEYKLSNSDAFLYGKGYLGIYYDDMASMLVIMALIGLFLALTFVILICSMISVIRKQRKATAIFYMDEVTGGRNWIWFLLKVGAFLRKRKNDKYNFAIVDLVFVNYRNFCMCHSVAEGEVLLTKVDHQVRGFLNKKKEACAHYASDHFALLLTYGSDEELSQKLSDLISTLEQIDPAHNFSFHLGVNKLPARTDKNGRPVRRKKLDIDEQYNNASTAGINLSDTEGSGIAYFDEKLVEEQKWLDIVQEEQKKALENEEFLVYYQPKYDPVKNELCGAEALIRWDSPKYGFQNPGKFIPIFEKNGFITEIDHYMIRHVAIDQKRWMDQGKKCVPVSVNVSRAHFIEHDLAEQIRDMVDEVGTPHHLIELELTESAFFDDKKAIIATIKRLKEYGFTVSMDDFGSGYSSLNSLKDMPLDVLKLDAEFFRGENTGERGEIVVKEALRLAKALHMKTVAEGVEVKEQVEFLADQGCDMIQGYYFAKPMPGTDYEKKMDGTGKEAEKNSTETEKSAETEKSE